ncbi:TIGR03086 family metal-binding protein [Rhodococcus sp. NPDC060086]|uniref:TIGR03086 family metal-binding protein n=1 Tax=Rhodococcus sp. NPDC060086 TaxID=3347055 RepID=UPI003656C53B
MTTMQTDPRPLFRDALNWVAGLIDGVRSAQFTDPTPCPEFDVRSLIGHLVSTIDRGRVIGAGGDPLTVPEVLTAPDDGWVAALRTSADHYWEVWNDDALLDTVVTAPWGTFPGRAAVLIALNEALVHGWDLAAATGQPAEADPDLANAALGIMQRALPETPRGGPVPFGPVVDPAPAAGATERLANWSGRVTEPWKN